MAPRAGVGIGLHSIGVGSEFGANTTFHMEASQMVGMLNLDFSNRLEIYRREKQTEFKILHQQLAKQLNEVQVDEE